MNKEILRLAIPNVISNISVPLLSTVDTWLMGQLSGLHLAAIGLGATLFNFLYWNLGFLRMGSTGITAQAYGANNLPDVINTLSRALLTGLCMAIILLVAAQPLEQLGITLLKISDEAAPLVSEYFHIRILAAPASIALIAIMGWFFGMQNAIFPLILTIIINVVNISLSYFLVKQWGWEVAGVAWGTVWAQYVGLVAAIGLFFWKYRYLIAHYEKKMVLQWTAFKRFLAVNRDIFLRTFLLTTAIAFFYRESSGQGDVVLAANTLLMQFFGWMSYGVDGFAYAAESLTGKYKGANKAPQTRRAIRYSFAWAMLMAVAYAVVYAWWGTDIVHFFTSDEMVLAATLPYLVWMIFLPIVSTPCFIWDGVFVGLTASRSMLYAMVVAFIGFIGVYYWLSPLYGNTGLWIALYVLMLLRGLVQQLLYLKKGINIT